MIRYSDEKVPILALELASRISKKKVIDLKCF